MSALSKTIKFIELFAGIGGFRYGLETIDLHKRLGKAKSQADSHNNASCKTKHVSLFSCVWANEMDKYACQIYRRNFGKDKTQGTHGGKYDRYCLELHEGDIKKVDPRTIPDHNLLCAGFPCQAFSIAGKRLGFSDTRGTLFFEIARILKEKRPRLLLLENVKGLLSHEKGRTFGIILATLDEIGYDLQWNILNSKNFGVPQNRERVFIVGHLRGTSRPKVFPIGSSMPTNNEELERTSTGTVKAGWGKYQNDATYLKDFGRIRRLTPTECERLQGFPDGWTEGVSDTQRYKCLGNAVTTNVITAIGKKL